MANKVTVRTLEAKILELEEVVVKIRASSDAEVSDYSYERKAAGNTSLTDWIEGRIKPLVEGYELIVINGDCATPHGRTKLSTLRDSYTK